MSENATVSEERYEELIGIAEDSLDLISLPDFWQISDNNSDEYSVIQFAKETCEALRELYSVSYHESDMERARALTELFEGRVLLSFISIYMPRLLDKGTPLNRGQTNTYHNECLERIKQDYTTELHIIENCILAMGKEPKPKFSSVVPAHLVGKEEMLFDNYAVLTVQAIKFLYLEAVEYASRFHRGIISGRCDAVGFAQESLECSDFAIRLLDGYLLNVIKVKKCQTMLFAMLVTLINSNADVYHNLTAHETDISNVGSSEHSHERAEEYRIKRAVYSSRLAAYVSLINEMSDNTELVDFCKKLVRAGTGDTALSHLCEFALRIKLGDKYIRGYYVDRGCGELLHWFTEYRLLKDTGNRSILSRMSTVADFLLELIDTTDAKYVLYHSNFYECITLEEAYRRRDFTSAEKIIRNGYDRYLEMSTLSIIYEYDRHAFRNYIKELKRICLERIIRNTDGVGTSAGNTFASIYGEDFTSELRTLALASLRTIDPSDKSDIRNRDERATPAWAKKK